MDRHPTLVDLSGMHLLIEDQVGCRADLVIRDDLRPTYRAHIEADAISIF